MSIRRNDLYTCTHCGEPLESFLQPMYTAIDGELVTLPDEPMVTCLNKTCWAYGHTRTLASHPHMDKLRYTGVAE